MYCVKYDDQEKYYGASYSDGTIKIFNAITGKLVQRMVNTTDEERRLSVNCFRFRPNPTGTAATWMKDVVVGVTTDGKVQYWHIVSGKCIHHIEPEVPEESIPYISSQRRNS